MDKLGKMIREARERMGHSPETMARRIGCSEGFARVIEAGKHVPVSPRLVERIMTKYDIRPKAPFRKAAEIRAKYGKRWYSEYQAAYRKQHAHKSTSK